MNAEHLSRTRRRCSSRSTTQASAPPGRPTSCTAGATATSSPRDRADAHRLGRVPPAGPGPARALLRRPVRVAPDGLPVAARAAGHARPARRLRRRLPRRARPLRLPAALAPGQRHALPQARPGRAGRRRSPRPTGRSSGSCSAAGGTDAFLEEHAVIVCSDHSQSPVEEEIDVPPRSTTSPCCRAAGRVRPERAEIAVCPSSRAAQVYVLDGSAARRSSRGPIGTLLAHRGRRPRDAADRPSRRRGAPSARARRAALRAARRPADARGEHVERRGRPRRARAARRGRRLDSRRTPTRSGACGRRCAAGRPARCSPPPSPATSSSTGAARTTSAAAPTARCTPSTRWARCCGAGPGPDAPTRASSGRCATSSRWCSTTSAWRLTRATAAVRPRLAVLRLLAPAAPPARAQDGATVRALGACVRPGARPPRPADRGPRCRSLRDRGRAAEVREARAPHPRQLPARVPGRARGAGRSLLHPARTGRSEEIAQVSSTTARARARGLDRLRVRVADGARLPGAFGRAVNSPWVWIPLCVLFALPFLRQPWRMLHLDLAVVFAFSVSFAFFGAANVEVSVPLGRPAAPVPPRSRMLWIGCAPPAPRRCACCCPPARCSSALAFLLGFRVALNIVDGNVIDVGYAGVVGADQLSTASRCTAPSRPTTRTATRTARSLYLAYVPFELVLAVERGPGTTCRRRTARRVAFDLALRGGCGSPGGGCGGPLLGLLLAYLWAAYPVHAGRANSGANDALVGAARARRAALLGRPGRARRPSPCRRPDEVRAAGARAAVRGHGRSAGGRTDALAAPRRPPSCSSRRVPLGTGSRCSGTGRSASRPTASRRSRSRGCTAASSGCRRCRPRGAGLALAVALVPAPPRRAHGGRAGGGRARRGPARARPTGSTSTSCGSCRSLLIALLAAQAAGRSSGSIASARRRPAQRISTALIHGSSSDGS